MDIKKTITSIFIVPTLKIDKHHLQTNNYLNGYIKDGSENIINYENVVYLLFKPKDLDVFRNFLNEEYKRTKDIIDDYDYENGYVVLVYKLEERFKRDFDLIKRGKYSKTSDRFKEMFSKTTKIIRNGNTREEISLQFRIFNKTEDLRKFWEDKLDVVFDDDMEVWHAFIEENEILNIEKIKEYV